MNPLSSGLLKPETLKKTSFILFVMTAVVIVIQHYYNPRFNNFKVFVSAFQQLIDLKNLHPYFSAEYDNLFLYVPPAAGWVRDFFHIQDWSWYYSGIVFYGIVFYHFSPYRSLSKSISNIVYEHSITALPVMLVWIKMHFDLFRPTSPFELKYLG